MRTPGKNTPAKDSTKKRFVRIRDFSSFVGVLLLGGVLAFILISFVFRTYAIEGASMQTTLHDQDKVLVWKVPRTIAKITKHEYIPNRGDIVIVDILDISPCGQSGEKQIVKRVLGLPGERVVVKDGKLMVFNKEHPNGFSPDDTLPYNEDGRIPFTKTDADFTLRTDQLFIAGDNRGNSCDSRIFGPIDADQIIGKLVFRLLPVNDITLF